MKYFIYRNLNRKGVVYSIKALEGSNRGKVVAYGDTIIIKNATLKVSQAGRKRCIIQQKRNVHAGIVGEIIGINNKTNRLNNDIKTLTTIRFELKNRISYNPYKNEGFMLNEKKIDAAKCVYLCALGAYVEL